MAKITRTFWVVPGVADKEGHPVEFPTLQAAQGQVGGIAGIGAKTPTEVQEEMTEDGEYVQTIASPVGADRVEIARGVDKARLDLYKTRREAGKEAAPKAPEVETLPSGEKVQYDPATGEWKPLKGVEQKPKPVAGEKPTVVPASATDKTSKFIVQQMPDGSVRRVPNPNYDPKAAANEREAEKRALTSAEIKQKRDEVDLAYTQGRISREQRDQEFDEWYKTRSLEHQERQAELANRREDRLATNQEKQFERQSTQDERRAKLDEETLGFSRQKAAYDVGQDTVRNAMAMVPYRVGPNFSSNFAAGVNTLSRGGGAVNFSPDDFAFKAPDFEGMREQSMQRALAAFQGTPPAFQPGAIPSGADIGAPPPAPVFPQIPAYLPPQRRMP